MIWKKEKYGESYIRTNKGVYIGDIEDKKKHGWGITINNNGNKYEGLFENDERNIFGSELLCCLYKHNYKNKKIKREEKLDGNEIEENSEKEFEKGNICLNSNRYIYIGNFKNGKKHGNGVLINYNNYVMYSCIFLNNVIVYKDILFSLINNYHSKYQKKSETINFFDKDTSSLNIENKGIKNKMIDEKDTFFFIKNKYKYTIFNYIKFYEHVMDKIKKCDLHELFLKYESGKEKCDWNEEKEIDYINLKENQIKSMNCFSNYYKNIDIINENEINNSIKTNDEPSNKQTISDSMCTNIDGNYNNTMLNEDKNIKQNEKEKKDTYLYNEINKMLPSYFRKKKKHNFLSLSYAQNSIYWNVFELNFFLFFVGISRKIIEIFIINEIDGYCLKYIENKLLENMGISDKMIKRCIILAVQCLLKLREKYKHKKKIKMSNNKIDKKLFLNKNKIWLLKLIGRGGYNNVYKCLYINNIKKCRNYKMSNYRNFNINHSINNIALKICIDKKYSYDFFSELKILSILRHPNVSLFLGGIRDPQAIALEYIPYGSIFDILHKKKTKIKILDIIKMCKDITSFMSFLHNKGILHCDLKSPNILLSESGEIKICDFGLSIQNFDNKPKYLGIVGTYQWTAPEILRGEGYTKKADIYSFGVILWELLHRTIPFNDLKHPLDIIAQVGYLNKQLIINNNINNKLLYVLTSCLHKDKRKRKSFFFWSEYFDILYKANICCENKKLSFLLS
ncbi:tyrosine kinase-like protein, putative [Plasmodium berghei]|uniref:Tyrosine kinase-like protein, putative n=2 Tax=Plasmodium berghei TaxID=5821 RepID=A0A509AEU9_PLABA|nr:tyrosine kinase-like protein, putative [Plasmodium berghei ANKA]CXH94527.1 tyrosine kinase-like protein, putative [Plasmodium berghei]SCL90930.1 tyrosine kinase-like protein, putative [Plasmodium berghei]SCM15385.1 tyrosine kinase-like protein, putative [Plasmodium berghei]SCM17179.1 tyrosine kinase-like protein, putative [Plasmodium berghei]SCN22217.1 tyrosine kinase-like protein, putative [Plasmodium berghei]|eukprot:XP_034419969.1 tyrosine kinase-like protein, putative [Plasmodium berghei ANKA]